MSSKKKIGILGASGYTGADAVRLLARHPNAEITALTANTHAGKAMDEVFPHFFMLDLPKLVEWEKVDWSKLDAVFCGLPHGTTQEIIAAVLAANPEDQDPGHVGRFPAPRHEHLRAMVRPRAPRAKASG